MHTEKTELANIHDKQIETARGGQSRDNRVARGIRTLDPVVLGKANTIERLAATRLPLGQDLNLIEID